MCNFNLRSNPLEGLVETFPPPLVPRGMSKTEEPPVEELLALLQSLQGKLKVLREAYLQQSAELNSLREKQDSQQKLVDELQEENEELNANLKRLRALQYKEAEESGAAGGGLHPRPTSGASLEPPILGFLEEVASTPDMQVQLLKQQLISLNADRVDLQRRLRQVAMQKVQREQVLQDKLSFRARQRELEAEYQSLPVALPGFFSLRSYKHTYLCCAVALGIQTMTANRNRAGPPSLFLFRFVFFFFLLS